MTAWNVQDGLFHFLFANEDRYILDSMVCVNLTDYLRHELSELHMDKILFVEGAQGSFAVRVFNQSVWQWCAEQIRGPLGLGLKGSQTYLTTYQYNEKGLLVQKDEEGTRGVTILYEYDEEDRLSQEKNLYTGYRNTYAYDEHGNLSVEKVFDYAGKQAWQYEYFYKLFPFEEE